MREERCEHCRWWDSEGEDTGDCRRYPARPHFGKLDQDEEGASIALTVWPMTRANDWCGEWKALTVTATMPPVKKTGLIADMPIWAAERIEAHMELPDEALPSVKIYNAVQKKARQMRATHFRDLLKVTRKEWLATDGVGPQSVEIIMEWLDRFVRGAPPPGFPGRRPD